MNVPTLTVVFALLLPAVCQVPAAAPAPRASDGVLRVAVLDFSNAAPTPGNSYDPARRGLAALLSAELAHRHRLSLVTRQAVDEATAETAVNGPGGMSVPRVVVAGRALGADLVLTGDFAVDRLGILRLHSQAVDVATGRVIRSATVTGERGDLLGLVSGLSAQLGAGFEAPRDSESITSVPTQAARLRAHLSFARALLAEDRGRNEDAITHYAAFVERSPADQRNQLRTQALERIAALSIPPALL